MNWRPIIAVVLIGGLATAGYLAYRFFKKQAALLQDYSVSLLSIKLLAVSESLLTMEFKVRITNQSVIEATVERVYADIYINSQYVGNVVNTIPFIIPAGKGKIAGSSDISLKATIAHKEVLKNIVSTLLSAVTTKDIPYQIKGSVKIKSGDAIQLSVPFEYAGSVKQDMLMSSAPKAA